MSPHSLFVLLLSAPLLLAQSCTTPDGSGVCVDVSKCDALAVPGYCKGSSATQCCVANSCTTPQGDGQCLQASKCTGTPVSGYCKGPSDIQCCVAGPLPPSGKGSRGFDLDGPVSGETLSCLAKEGRSFGIFRAWHSYGAYDTSACTNIASAHSASIKSVGVYMFPCPKCSTSASEQVAKMVSSLKSDGCSYGSTGSKSYHKVWLDIEGGSQFWSSDHSTNNKFFKGLLSGCSAQGVSCGVYTNKDGWTEIMGSSFAGASDLPLWYAHYDNNPTFSDFKPFGGWSQPYMKQFQGDVTVCGQDLDENVLPSGVDGNHSWAFGSTKNATVT